MTQQNHSRAVPPVPSPPSAGKPLVQLLETLIRADVVEAIMNVPHLTLAERKIAIGRALRRGVVEDLMAEIVTEEISLAAAEGGDISDDLAEALLATVPPTDLA